MNPFVNPKKRGNQLSNGAKDLTDVLRGKRHKLQLQALCEYCGVPASVLISVMGGKDDQYCKQCRQDMEEFAKIEISELWRVHESGDEAAISRFRIGVQRRQDAFMRKRVKARTPK